MTEREREGIAMIPKTGKRPSLWKGEICPLLSKTATKRCQYIPREFSQTEIVVDVVCQFGAKGIFIGLPKKTITRLVTDIKERNKNRKIKVNRLVKRDITPVVRTDYSAHRFSSESLASSVLKELTETGHLRANVCKKRVRYSKLPCIREIKSRHDSDSGHGDWSQQVKKNRRKYRSWPGIKEGEDEDDLLTTIIVTNSSGLYNESSDSWKQNMMSMSNSTGCDVTDSQNSSILSKTRVSNSRENISNTLTKNNNSDCTSLNTASMQSPVGRSSSSSSNVLSSISCFCEDIVSSDESNSAATKSRSDETKDTDLPSYAKYQSSFYSVPKVQYQKSSKTDIGTRGFSNSDKAYRKGVVSSLEFTSPPFVSDVFVTMNGSHDLPEIPHDELYKYPKHRIDDLEKENVGNETSTIKRDSEYVSHEGHSFTVNGYKGRDVNRVDESTVNDDSNAKHEISITKDTKNVAGNDKDESLEVSYHDKNINNDKVNIDSKKVRGLYSGVPKTSSFLQTSRILSEKTENVQHENAKLADSVKITQESQLQQTITAKIDELSNTSEQETKRNFTTKLQSHSTYDSAESTRDLSDHTTTPVSPSIDTGRIIGALISKEKSEEKHEHSYFSKKENLTKVNNQEEAYDFNTVEKLLNDSKQKYGKDAPIRESTEGKTVNEINGKNVMNSEKKVTNGLQNQTAAEKNEKTFENDLKSNNENDLEVSQLLSIATSVKQAREKKVVRRFGSKSLFQNEDQITSSNSIETGVKLRGSKFEKPELRPLRNITLRNIQGKFENPKIGSEMKSAKAGESIITENGDKDINEDKPILSKDGNNGKAVVDTKKSNMSNSPDTASTNEAIIQAKSLTSTSKPERSASDTCTNSTTKTTESQKETNLQKGNQLQKTMFAQNVSPHEGTIENLKTGIQGFSKHFLSPSSLRKTRSGTDGRPHSYTKSSSDIDSTTMSSVTPRSNIKNTPQVSAKTEIGKITQTVFSKDGYTKELKSETKGRPNSYTKPTSEIDIVSITGDSKAGNTSQSSAEKVTGKITQTDFSKDGYTKELKSETKGRPNSYTKPTSEIDFVSVTGDSKTGNTSQLSEEKVTGKITQTAFSKYGYTKELKSEKEGRPNSYMKPTSEIDIVSLIGDSKTENTSQLSAEKVKGKITKTHETAFSKDAYTKECKSRTEQRPHSYTKPTSEIDSARIISITANSNIENLSLSSTKRGTEKIKGFSEEETTKELKSEIDTKSVSILKTTTKTATKEKCKIDGKSKSLTNAKSDIEKGTSTKFETVIEKESSPKEKHALEIKTKSAEKVETEMEHKSRSPIQLQTSIDDVQKMESGVDVKLKSKADLIDDKLKLNTKRGIEMTVKPNTTISLKSDIKNTKTSVINVDSKLENKTTTTVKDEIDFEDTAKCTTKYGSQIEVNPKFTSKVNTYTEVKSSSTTKSDTRIEVKSESTKNTDTRSDKFVKELESELQSKPKTITNVELEIEEKTKCPLKSDSREKIISTSKFETKIENIPKSLKVVEIEVENQPNSTTKDKSEIQSKPKSTNHVESGIEMKSTPGHVVSIIEDKSKFITNVNSEIEVKSKNVNSFESKIESATTSIETFDSEIESKTNISTTTHSQIKDRSSSFTSSELETKSARACYTKIESAPKDTSQKPVKADIEIESLMNTNNKSVVDLPSNTAQQSSTKVETIAEITTLSKSVNKPKESDDKASVLCEDLSKLSGGDNLKSTDILLETQFDNSNNRDSAQAEVKTAKQNKESNNDTITMKGLPDVSTCNQSNGDITTPPTPEDRTKPNLTKLKIPSSPSSLSPSSSSPSTPSSTPKIKFNDSRRLSTTSNKPGNAGFSLTYMTSMDEEPVIIPEVKPGFFHLNVVLLSDRDRLYLTQTIALLEARLATEHEIVSQAIKNLICVFMCQDRSRRLEARNRLSQLKEKHPENLNTLANLEFIYRASHRMEDANACRKTINELIEKRGRKCDVLKAQCLLEQAYIYTLVYNDYTAFEIVQERMQDVTMRLEETKRFCNSLNTRFAVETAYGHVHRMTRNVLNEEGQIKRKSFDKEFCLTNYEGGMELLATQPGTEEIIVIWAYYQAIANYLLSDLAAKSSKVNDTGMFRKKAAHLFLRVFKNLNPELRIYRARCLAFLGHLLSTTFEGKGDVFKDTLETFKITVTQQGGVPLFLFDKAKTFCNNEDDSVVLTTEAQHYMFKAFHKTKDQKDKKRSLERADVAITKAIKALEDQQMNWVAYTLRRDINFSLHELSTSHAENNLRQAKRDGEAAVLKGGVVDFVHLGRICYALAVCQPQSRRLNSIPDKNDVLYEGLDYLQQAIERGVQSKVKVQCYEALSKCLFQLKQHRHAIECLKRVIEEDAEKSTDLVKQLFLFFLQNYKQTGKQNGIIILHELLFWVDWCCKKYGEDDVISLTAKLTKDYYTEMVDMLEIVTDKVSKNGTNAMLTKFKQKLEKIKQNESKKLQLPKSGRSLFGGSPLLGRRKDKTEKKTESSTCVNNLIKSAMQLPIMIPQSYGSYDFYVFNSLVDNDWVMHVLRPAMEDSFGFDPLRGYIAGRDFSTSDCGRIGPLKFALSRGLKIVIILTEDFVTNEWFRYERREKDAIGLLEEKAMEGYIVPVLLDSNLDLDEEILKVTGEHMVKPTDWDTLRRFLL